MTLALESDSGFEKHRKPTRRDEFLAQMDQVAPWKALCALIDPVYPKVRKRGSRLSGVRRFVACAKRGLIRRPLISLKPIGYESVTTLRPNK